MHLLLNDEKNIIIGNLQWLCNKELIRIYGYVPDSYRDAQSLKPFVEPVGNAERNFQKIVLRNIALIVSKRNCKMKIPEY
jgi:hypothetical protein